MHLLAAGPRVLQPHREGRRGGPAQQVRRVPEAIRFQSIRRSAGDPGEGIRFFLSFFLRGIQRVVGIRFFKGQLREGWGLPRERFDEGSVPFMVTQKRFGRHMMRV